MASDMMPIYISLSILAGILIGVFVAVLVASLLMTAKGWAPPKVTFPPLKGLLIPRGSVRAMLAFLIAGAFIIFVFMGENALNDEHFESVLTAFGTLTGAVTGFYFGTRGSEPDGEGPDATSSTPTGPASSTSSTTGRPGTP